MKSIFLINQHLWTSLLLTCLQATTIPDHQQDTYPRLGMRTPTQPRAGSKRDSGAESELLERPAEHRDGIYFSHLICIDVHSPRCTAPAEGILGRGQKGSARLTYFKSPRADNQDVFQSLNTHCCLKLHITKRVRNCQDTKLSLTGRVSDQREPESGVINVALADFWAGLSQGPLPQEKSVQRHPRDKLLPDSSLSPSSRTILHLSSTKLLNEAAPQPPAANNFQSILQVTSPC